jgi:NAD(P)-dependent dehydrogenase (short-subunit alcohol dehydrogenase family)
MDRFRVDGKVALVTGAGSGLGRQFAVTLAEAGATVGLAARRREKLAETAALIEDIGGQSISVDLDVTDARSVTSCVRNVTSELGAPDILVNNAGIARQAFITDIAEDDWDAVIDTNLKGVFMVAQAVAKEMIRSEKGGSIINIASILGIGVSKALASYIAAKSGVINLTKAMALEWTRANIRVNAIAPGYFVTEINQEAFDQGAHELVKQAVPMGRVGEMAEISGPLLLLASDAGSYITGANVCVDGGMTTTFSLSG